LSKYLPKFLTFALLRQNYTH